MTGSSAAGDYRAQLVGADDHPRLTALRNEPGVTVLDHREAQRAELLGMLPRVDPEIAAEPTRWAYYPWRRSLVGVLGPRAFRLVRLDRNRNKITTDEQQRLGRLRIGVVGLSVGHVIAHTLAMEGVCGHLRLADFDTVELSNLNRIPGTLFDLGVNKAVVAARRIAELDPYLEVSVVEDGLTTETLPGFLDGLDAVIEECDSLDAKVLVREAARARRLPVLMETSDRGLLDVERFDLEPQRPLFHGLLGAVNADSLADLTVQQKLPLLLQLLDADALSARIAASLVEVGQTLSTWPQLGGDVVLGAATMSAAVRRLGLGAHLPSGRLRIDLDERLGALQSPAVPARPVVAEPPAPERLSPGPAAVLEAVRRAPSGGNVQPWAVASDAESLQLYLVRECTTTMDVGYRGSYVALGAALFNARVAAAAAKMLGPVELFPDASCPDLVATLYFGDGAEPELSAQYPGMLARCTNRRAGTPHPLPAPVQAALHAAAQREGGELRLLTETSAIAAAGDILGGADRLRYLTPTLHTEMMSELAWPGRDRLDVGLDVRTLELDDANLATLQVIGRPDVMAYLAQWKQGAALSANTRQRVASSSALAVVTVDGAGPADFVRGGGAVESVWIAAQEHGLAVQPVSPVFLYGLDDADRSALSAVHAAELADLQEAFRRTAHVPDGHCIALVLRLGHAPPPRIPSQRKPLNHYSR